MLINNVYYFNIFIICKSLLNYNILRIMTFVQQRFSPFIRQKANNTVSAINHNNIVLMYYNI